MKDRVKYLREVLDLSQEAFGNRIGITRSSVSNIEKGTRNMSDRTLKSICREFNVNYFWLRDGIGDVFIEIPDTILDELAQEYDMSSLEKEIMRNYLKMDKETRNAFIETIKNLFNMTE